MTVSLHHCSRTFIRAAALACTLATPSSAHAASAQEIDIEVDAALERFRTEIDTANAYLEKAKGVLVFPSVVKAGFGIGGEYGEGALRVDGKSVDYYSTAAASIGFQLGAQARTVVLVFLDESALQAFRASKGWEAGVDGSITVVKTGVEGTVDTTNVKDPIVGFVFGNKGLMYDLSLEGSKYTRLDK